MKKIQNRNKSLKNNPSRRLASYLSAGVFVAATEARADIVVTRYSSPDDYPSGISIPIAQRTLLLAAYPTYIGANVVDAAVTLFTRGSDLSVNSHNSGGYYRTDSGFLFGAEGSSANYVSIDFGADGVYEAVGQFDFVTPGSGTLVALALDTTGATLSISAGKAAIDAAAVPEPSGLLLGLLALGAAGCRRRRVAVPPRQVS